MVDLTKIRAQLLGTRYRASEVPAVYECGVYAFFAKPGTFKGLSIDASGLLYVGRSGSSLAGRNHFTHKQSGFSSLRRSLGALLKNELKLRALPRAPGLSPRNIQNYRFHDEGEECLTNWMEDHLTFSFAVVRGDIKAVEKALIADLQPPLNLTDWPNPEVRYVMDLRAVCAGEARASQTGAR